MSEIATLLPPNATPQTRALEQVMAAPKLGLDQPIGTLWNPETCPEALLPWLAWALSVDDWEAGWSEARQRKVIAASINVHRHKGTLAGAKAALAAMGYGSAQVTEAKDFPRLGGGAPDASGVPLGTGWRLGDTGARLGTRPTLSANTVLPLGTYWQLGKPASWADYMVSIDQVIAREDADAIERRMADVVPARCRFAGAQIHGIRHALGDGDWTLGATIPLGGAYGKSAELYAPNVGGAYTVGPYTPVMAAKFAGGAVSWGGFAERLSFSRASVATYIDADGIMQTAPANDMRVDWSSGSGRLLIEAAKTRLNASPIATAANWVAQGTPTLTDAGLIVGGVFGGLLVSSGGQTWHRAAPPNMTLAANTTYCVKQWYCEPDVGSSGKAALILYATGGAIVVNYGGPVGALVPVGSPVGATVDAVRQTVVAHISADRPIYEIELVFTVGATGSTGAFGLGPYAAAGDVTALGQMVTTAAGADDTIGSWILENPAGTALRKADFCNIDLTGLGLQDGYTLLVRGNMRGVVGAYDRIAQMDNGNAANRQLLLYHEAIDQFRGEVLTGDVFQAWANFGGVLGADFRMAAAIGPDHAQWAFDGAAANIGDPSVSFVTPDTLRLGNGGAGGVPARLEIDEFRLFRGPLSQQYLELMTAPGA